MTASESLGHPGDVLAGPPIREEVTVVQRRRDELGREVGGRGKKAFEADAAFELVGDRLDVRAETVVELGSRRQRRSELPARRAHDTKAVSRADVSRVLLDL